MAKLIIDPSDPEARQYAATAVGLVHIPDTRDLELLRRVGVVPSTRPTAVDRQDLDDLKDYFRRQQLPAGEPGVRS